MPTTTIFVHTSAASAVKHACQHGRHALQVDLSTWTQRERDWLAAHIAEDNGACFAHSNPTTPIPVLQTFRNNSEKVFGDTNRLNWIDVAPPTTDQLRNVVLERMAEDLRRQAEQDAQAVLNAEAAEKRFVDTIEILRTCPIEEFVEKRPPYTTLRASSVAGTPIRYDDLSGSKDAIDFVPARRPELEAYIASRLEADAAEKAENEAKAERKKAAELADREAFALWLQSLDRHEQAERFEAGVLPIAEAQDVIRQKIIAPYAKLNNLNTFTEYERFGTGDLPQTWNPYQWDNIKAAKRTVENIQNFWGLRDNVKLTIHEFYEYIRDPENEDADEDGDVIGDPTIVAKISVTFHGVLAAIYFYI